MIKTIYFVVGDDNDLVISFDVKEFYVIDLYDIYI